MYLCLKKNMSPLNYVSPPPHSAFNKNPNNQLFLHPPPFSRGEKKLRITNIYLPLQNPETNEFAPILAVLLDRADIPDTTITEENKKIFSFFLLISSPLN